MRYLVLIIITMAILTTNCGDDCEDKHSTVPDSCRLNYKLYDTLVFVSNQGKYDTIYVSDIDTLESEREYQDTYCSELHTWEILSYLFTRVNKDSLFGSVDVKYTCYTVVTLFSERFKANNRGVLFDTIIDGFKYNDISFFTSEHEESNVEFILYHLHKGVVYYETNQNEKWHLINIKL